MFKIGEFSKLTQVSIRMLRHYDETGLLKPAQIDKFTNYRLYSVEQISTLNKIVFLRDLGFNISEIAVCLDKWSDDYITGLLEEKRHGIENLIKSEQERISKIDLAKRDIKKGRITINYNVSIKSVPSYQVLSLRRIVPNYYAEGMLWKEMAEFAQRNSISVSDNTLTIYHDPDYRETDVDIEICAPVEKMGENKDGFTFCNTEAVPMMASTMVYGGFENIAEAYGGFAGWLQEHSGYSMGYHSRQIVHRGPWNEEDPSKYLIEIQVPLNKK